jgi:hypothetical protein
MYSTMHIISWALVYEQLERIRVLRYFKQLAILITRIIVYEFLLFLASRREN